MGLKIFKIPNRHSNASVLNSASLFHDRKVPRSAPSSLVDILRYKKKKKRKPHYIPDPSIFRLGLLAFEQLSKMCFIGHLFIKVYCII